MFTANNVTIYRQLRSACPRQAARIGVHYSGFALTHHPGRSLTDVTGLV
jgi:hypothetical protein